MTTELRYLDTTNEDGTVTRELQWRDAAYAPWRGVEVVTADAVAADASARQDRARIRRQHADALSRVWEDDAVPRTNGAGRDDSVATKNARTEG